jgi:hypothetical protein
MGEFIRIYVSRLPTANIAMARDVIADKLASALVKQPGCRSVKILLDADSTSDAQVTTAALSTHWDSLEELRAAVETEAVAEGLLQLLPLVDVGEVSIRTFAVEDFATSHSGDAESTAAESD